MQFHPFGWTEKEGGNQWMWKRERWELGSKMVEKRKEENVYNLKLHFTSYQFIVLSEFRSKITIFFFFETRI